MGGSVLGAGAKALSCRTTRKKKDKLGVVALVSLKKICDGLALFLREGTTQPFVE